MLTIFNPPVNALSPAVVQALMSLANLRCGNEVRPPRGEAGPDPGSLGRQRLPRLAGAEFALDMMTTGRMIDSRRALKAGIISELNDQAFAAAVSRARELATDPKSIRRTSEVGVHAACLPVEFLKSARAQSVRKPKYPALAALVTATEAAVELPFAEGEQVAAKEFGKLLRSPQSRALRHLFFAERQAAKIPAPAGGATPTRHLNCGHSRRRDHEPRDRHGIRQRGLSPYASGRQPDGLDRRLSVVRSI